MDKKINIIYCVEEQAMDIDSASMELAKSFGGLPPKLRYRFRRFLQKLVSNPTQHDQNDPNRVQKMADEMVKMITEEYGSPLAKNEARFSAYENGSVRMDFGEQVPENVKKAAITWAKTRGLSAIEASMMKSMKSSEYVIMAKDNNSKPDMLTSVVSKMF